MPEPHNWETDPRPLSDCLKAWHGRPDWSRERAATELRVSPSTYNGWCAGRGCALEGSIRRLMTLIDDRSGRGLTRGSMRPARSELLRAGNDKRPEGEHPTNFGFHEARLSGTARMHLSRRQIKTADRVGGIELMIPWPANLRAPTDLGDDEERPATPVEHAAAMSIVAAECEAHDLVPVRVSAIRTPQYDSNGAPMGNYLGVVIIGRRWVHAKTKRRPITAWIE